MTSKQREEAALISEKPGVDRLETSTSYLVNYSKNGIIIGMDARCHKLPDRQNGIRKKRRIAFLGHLCDEVCGKFVSRLLNDNTKSVMLGHLSDTNNLPELAYESVKLEITMADNPYDGLDFAIYVAKKNELSRIIDL